MKPESIVLAVAGAFFGLIVGWVLGSQQAGPSRFAAAPAAVQQAAPAPGSGRRASGAGAAPARPGARPSASRQPPRRTRPTRRPAWISGTSTSTRSDTPRPIDVVPAGAEDQPERRGRQHRPRACRYYYSNDPDRALQQFEASLKADPKHTKTLLNQGIVKAFGKQDLKGAVAAWEKLIADRAGLARRRRPPGRALQGLKSAHPGAGGQVDGPEAPARMGIPAPLSSCSSCSGCSSSGRSGSCSPA